MLIAFAVLLLVALVLLAIGLHGRRIDDHPLCRQCRFDLTGRPPESTRCPECGAELSGPRAIVVGHRRRRQAPLTAGATLLGMVLVAALALLWASAHQTRWLHYAPLGYVLRDAASVDPARRKAALVELSARAKNNRLSNSAWDRVADVGLAYQADVTRPWDYAWGQWLEDARAAGHLSDQRWRTYALQSCGGVFQLQVRPRVRRGDPIPAHMPLNWWRVGLNCPFLMACSGPELSYADEPASEPQFPPWSPFVMSTYSLTSQDWSLAPDSYAHRPDGVQRLHLTAFVRLWMPETPPPGAPLTTLAFDIPATFHLLPADQSTVRMIHDPSLTEKVRQALSGLTLTHKSSGMCLLSLATPKPPVGIAFEVLLRAGGREMDLGSIAAPAGSTDELETAADWTLPRASTVDVIFRPNSAAAAETVDTFDAWDGADIVFSNVAVH